MATFNHCNIYIGQQAQEQAPKPVLYKCNACGQPFTKKSSLDRHMKQTCLARAYVPHTLKCPFCIYTSNRLFNINVHAKNAHPGEKKITKEMAAM